MKEKTIVAVVVTIVITLAFSALVASCGIEPDHTVHSNDGVVSIVIIDECEYIKNHGSHLSYTYTHKGNCNNPIHNYRVEKD